MKDDGSINFQFLHTVFAALLYALVVLYNAFILCGNCHSCDLNYAQYLKGKCRVLFSDSTFSMNQPKP